MTERDHLSTNFLPEAKMLTGEWILHRETRVERELIALGSSSRKTELAP